MDQLHLLLEDDGIYAFDIYLKILDFLKKQSININYEESSRLVQTYYDGLGMFILRNGGYLRKTAEVNDNQETVGEMFYEFRPRTRSQTKLIKDYNHLNRSELSKIYNINTKLIKEFKFFMNHNFMNFNLNVDDEYNPHLNFIVDSGEIVDYNGVSRPVTVFSLSDATMIKYNHFIANLSRDNIERFIGNYSKFMKQFKLKKITANRYQELREVLDKAIQKENECEDLEVNE